MKIGVIGYGNMGSMIVNNILKLNLLLDDEELIVSNRHIKKIEHLTEEYPDAKLSIMDNNINLAKECEKIIICVETPQFKDILNEISPFLNENTHLIYTCAGLNFEHIEPFYNGKLTLIIPTIASTVTSNNTISSTSRRKGVTLIKHNSKIEMNDSYFIEDLFNEFSFVKKIDDVNYFIEGEDDLISTNNTELEISTILSSCGPAFIAKMIDKFAESASNKGNISKVEAEEIILKTLIGTSILKENQELYNSEIIDKVATKGGITQEGVDFLDKKINKIASDLIETLLNRYEEVNEDMDKEYLNN